MKQLKLILFFLILLFSKDIYSQVYIKLTGIPDNTPVNARIFIAGNFNGFRPGNDFYELKKDNNGLYSLTFNTNLKEIEYKFTLGEWEREECLKNGVPSQTRKSTIKGKDTILVQIEAWKEVLRKHTASKNVSIVKEDFYMPQLNRTRRIWIYLPPDYNESKHSYPVLYAHDGQNLFDAATSYSCEWGIDETLDSLFAINHTASIVVGIDNGGDFRTEELTPWTNQKYGGGKAELYADFIVKTLKPYIDSNYRTLPDQKNTGVFGSSFGGLASFYMAMKYPDVFSKIGVFSPSFWFSDKVYEMAKGFNKKNDFEMYIIGGGIEYGPNDIQIPKMKKIMESKGLSAKEFKLEMIADGEHNEWFWRREFPKVYLWLME